MSLLRSLDERFGADYWADAQDILPVDADGCETLGYSPGPEALWLCDEESPNNLVDEEGGVELAPDNDYMGRPPLWGMLAHGLKYGGSLWGKRGVGGNGLANFYATSSSALDVATEGFSFSALTRIPYGGNPTHIQLVNKFNIYSGYGWSIRLLDTNAIQLYVRTSGGELYPSTAAFSPFRDDGLHLVSGTIVRDALSSFVIDDQATKTVSIAGRPESLSSSTPFTILNDASQYYWTERVGLYWLIFARNAAWTRDGHDALYEQLFPWRVEYATHTRNGRIVVPIGTGKFGAFGYQQPAHAHDAAEDVVGLIAARPNTFLGIRSSAVYLWAGTSATNTAAFGQLGTKLAACVKLTGAGGYITSSVATLTGSTAVPFRIGLWAKTATTGSELRVTAIFAGGAPPTITWNQTSTTAPTSNMFPMGYHVVRDVVIMVRSSNAETWQYTPADDTWANLSQSDPGSSSYRRMVYDSVRAKLWMYGRFDQDRTVWEWDGTWTSRGTGGPSSPAGGTAAYDSAAQRVIWWNSNTNETWEFNGAAGTWAGPYTSGTRPLGRAAGYMAYLPSLGKTVFYGGYAGGTYQNQTYAYTQSTHTWEQLSPPASPSSGRAYGGFCYDSGRNGLVIAGGWTAGGRTNQVWLFNGTTWSQLTDNYPLSIDGNCLAYDSSRSLLVGSGGSSGAGLSTNTYEGVVGASTQETFTNFISSDAVPASWTKFVGSVTPTYSGHTSLTLRIGCATSGYDVEIDQVWGRQNCVVDPPAILLTAAGAAESIATQTTLTTNTDGDTYTPAEGRLQVGFSGHVADSSNTVDECLFRAYPASGDAGVLYVRVDSTSHTLKAAMYNASGTLVADLDSALNPDADHHFVTVLWKAASAAPDGHNFSLYVDSVLKDYYDGTWTPATAASVTTVAWWSASGSSKEFNGIIEYARVHDVADTYAPIYSGTLTAQAVSDTDLTATYTRTLLVRDGAYGVDQYSYIIQYGYSFFVTDVDAPYLAAQDPYPDETGVVKDKVIVFQLLDNVAGVDPDEVNIYIEGVLAYDGSSFISPYNDTGSTRTAVTNGYEYHIEKTSDWDSWKLISVRVVAQDLQYPPNVLDETYYFRAEDYLGPLVDPVAPYNHQVNVSVSTNIKVELTDEDLFDDIVIEVNQGAGWETAFEEGGTPEFKPAWDGPGSGVSAIEGGIRIIIDPVVPLVGGTMIQVRVTAFDETGNPARL